MRKKFYDIIYGIMRYYEYQNCPRILKAKIDSKKVFDLVPPTIYALLDDLVPGSELMEDFLAEMAKFEADELNYGVWVHYPGKDHLVRFTPKFWHRLTLVLRNSTLLSDPESKMSWKDIRNKLENSVISVAGCSVGNNAAHAIAGDIRPLHIKIADQKDYQIHNANRVRLNYEDFGRNKAIVTAEQIHAIDPFIKVSVYSEGIHEKNIADFVGGNKELSEPVSSVIIEETDDPDMKILIREKARRCGIPVIMVSDIGSAVQLDIRRFDVSKSFSLASCGIFDEELYSKRDKWQRDLANRDKFYEFAFSLIGRNHEKTPEFKKIILKEAAVLFGGVPQLGSTAMAAGGIAAEAAARLLLGFKMPERMFINKHTGEVAIDGEKL